MTNSHPSQESGSFWDFGEIDCKCVKKVVSEEIKRNIYIYIYINENRTLGHFRHFIQNRRLITALIGTEQPLQERKKKRKKERNE